VTSPNRWSLRNAFVGPRNPDFSTPFRSRARTGSSATSRPRRTSAARLWNPTNSTPRVYPQPSQQESIPRKQDRAFENNSTAVTVALHHPALGSPRQYGGAPGDYPLLTLPEQRQNRHSGSIRGSLQVERSGSSTHSNRISLPRSVSIDISRRKSGERSPLAATIDKGKGKAVEYEGSPGLSLREGRQVSDYGSRAQTTSRSTAPVQGLSFDKGKGVATMATDLERGSAIQNPYTPGGTSSLPHNPINASNGSLHSGIGPALSSRATSVNSWAEQEQEQSAEDEWGPQHPCYPHMNPHVPLSSPLYQTTRVIRIRRDWMLEGDLAPTFSNLYPEILDPAGVSEQEFRSIVDRVNRELIPAFNPWGARNMLDATLGLLTGWMWDDFGLTGVKARLQKVEQYLEEWNREMEIKSKDGPGSVPQIVSLRRTGYMNVRSPSFRVKQGN